MKKRLPAIIMILIFVIGLSVLLYPVISDFVNSRSQTRAIDSYNGHISEMETEEFEELLEQAREYNKNMTSGTVSYMDEAEAQALYMGLLSIDGSGIMGYIEIPRIDVSLPIYHGTGDAVLQTGIGHLQGSSLPVGGRSTHAALSGHRGLPSSKLLTNLDQLVPGDVFTLHVLNIKMTYRVDQVEVVEPDDTELLAVAPNEDYVTLITCTPYGVNTHRLLVRGSRIENPPEDLESAEPGVHYKDPFLEASVVISAVIVLVAVLIIIRSRKAGKRSGTQEKHLSGDHAQANAKGAKRNDREE